MYTKQTNTKRTQTESSIMQIWGRTSNYECGDMTRPNEKSKAVS